MLSYWALLLCAYTTSAVVPNNYFLNPVKHIDMSNKTVGAGYQILNNGTTHLYYNINQGYSAVKAVVKYVPHTFFFYKDGVKVYIRDDKCRFLCVNICGQVFLSPVRFRNVCRFVLHPTAENSIKIYTVIGDAAQPVYKTLEFAADKNLLTTQVGQINETSASTDFNLNVPPLVEERHQNNCLKIQETVRLNLDASPTNWCKLPDLQQIKGPRQKVAHIGDKTQTIYNIQLNEETFVSETGVGADRSTYFFKYNVGANQLVFANSANCKFMCQNKCGSVYFTHTFNADCIARLHYGRGLNKKYVRFDNSNLYMSLNISRLGYSEMPMSSISFVAGIAKSDKVCSFNLQTDAPADEQCKNKAALLLTLPFITMFIQILVSVMVK
ncbi:fgf-2 [Hyphantria cunea granulovirus]|uniref:Fgf-2 n=1 Tax=Hyphantria cunea granulovirus TaxID=307448 RepID=A0AAF1D2A9_9BBAC|nr:fgf-2 [Hyphantria cunea granulovirus]QBQ01661.1 fgf-2 [Hyphantria cunea granulovirus]